MQQAKRALVDSAVEEMLDDLYQRIVPEQERTEIEGRIRQEEAQTAAETEAARRFAVYRIRELGEDSYFTSEAHNDLYLAACECREYLQDPKPFLLPDYFSHRQICNQFRYSQLVNDLGYNPQITMVVELDADKGMCMVQKAGEDDSWHQYRMKDLSTGIFRAKRKDGRSYGKVVIAPDESKWVIYIFEQYILGESYKSLSDALSSAGVLFDVDKPWNKNMIARLLQDQRYTGDEKFPQIIETCIFQQVNEKRNKKVVSSTVTKAQKILKRKCNGSLLPHVEQEVLFLLNGLAGNTEQIEIPNVPTTGNSIVEARQAELEELLGTLPVDEVQASQKLTETTVAMYEAIDPREYETHRLKRIFSSEQARTELDGTLLEQTVTAVTVDSLGKVRIRLIEHDLWIVLYCVIKAKSIMNGGKSMNIRKNIDYSKMYEALDRLMAQELPQMELYCEIGKAVCKRTEKGAAVLLSF